MKKHVREVLHPEPEEPTLPVTKSEALELIANQLRNPQLPPNQLIKLITLQARLSCWTKRTNAGLVGVNDEPSFDRLVIEAERKRRAKSK